MADVETVYPPLTAATWPLLETTIPFTEKSTAMKLELYTLPVPPIVAL